MVAEAPVTPPPGDWPPVTTDKGLQPLTICLLYLCPALAGLIILVRLAKKRVDRTLGGDDAILVLGWILAVVNSVLVHLFVLTTYAGYHDKDVPFWLIDSVRASKLQVALGAEYNPVVCLIKMSFLWSLQKLRSANISIQWSLWAIQIFNAIYMVVSTVVATVPCLPIEKKWHPEVPGTCMSGEKYVLANVSLVLITDLLVVLLPTWIIWDLQMPTRRKLVTISFLSLGLILIGVGIARLIWLHKAFKGDIVSYSVESAYSAIESSVAIIGACGPTVKYILGFCFPWLRTVTKQASNYNSSSQYRSGSRRVNAGRSKRSDAYDDLDDLDEVHEVYEMKHDWDCKKIDSDARSDEQRITSDYSDRIVKTVDVSVTTHEHVPRIQTKHSQAESRAVQPAQVL